MILANKSLTDSLQKGHDMICQDGKLLACKCSSLDINISEKDLETNCILFEPMVPLVQANFYVTESEHGKQDLFYYRKSIWEMVRLLPKENGVRVLANLKASSRIPVTESSLKVKPYQSLGKVYLDQKHVKYDYFKSVNSVLRDLHAVLRGLQMKEPDKLGSSNLILANEDDGIGSNICTSSNRSLHGILVNQIMMSQYLAITYFLLTNHQIKFQYSPINSITPRKQEDLIVEAIPIPAKNLLRP
ncbi:unnamed protein product [Thlaspi arvense]|uniref:Telomerase reverse transcriptase n=1 Tax=Thlaspi arvense TaxID=13288 RepID=A0AAU9RH41_THLAR|nr:unnamed protein product [Thlaspi arvense]